MILNSSSLATTSSFNNNVKVLLLLSRLSRSCLLSIRNRLTDVDCGIQLAIAMLGSTSSSPHRCLSSIRLHLQKVANITWSQCMGPVSASPIYQVATLTAKLSTISTVWKPRWVMKDVPRSKQVRHLLPLSRLTPYLLLPVNCTAVNKMYRRNSKLLFKSIPPLNTPSLPSIPPPFTCLASLSFPGEDEMSAWRETNALYRPIPRYHTAKTKHCVGRITHKERMRLITYNTQKIRFWNLQVADATVRYPLCVTLTEAWYDHASHVCVW